MITHINFDTTHRQICSVPQLNHYTVYYITNYWYILEIKLCFKSFQLNSLPLFKPYIFKDSYWTEKFKICFLYTWCMYLTSIYVFINDHLMYSTWISRYILTYIVHINDPNQDVTCCYWTDSVKVSLVGTIKQ